MKKKLFDKSKLRQCIHELKNADAVHHDDDSVSFCDATGYCPVLKCVVAGSFANNFIRD